MVSTRYAKTCVISLVVVMLSLTLISGCSFGPSVDKDGDKINRSSTDVKVEQEDKDGQKLSTKTSGNLGHLQHVTTTTTQPDGTVIKTVTITISEGEPVVQKGGWSFGILFRLGYWWIAIIPIIGIICYFFWPLIFRLLIMASEGFGKAFSPSTFNAVVRSVQRGREAVKKKYGEDALKTFDDELSKDQDDKVKRVILKQKSKMKSQRVINGVSTVGSKETVEGHVASTDDREESET